MRRSFAKKTRFSIILLCHLEGVETFAVIIIQLRRTAEIEFELPVVEKTCQLAGAIVGEVGATRIRLNGRLARPENSGSVDGWA